MCSDGNGIDGSLGIGGGVRAMSPNMISCKSNFSRKIEKARENLFLFPHNIFQFLWVGFWLLYVNWIEAFWTRLISTSDCGLWTRVARAFSFH